MKNRLLFFLKNRHYTIVGLVLILLVIIWYVFNFFWGERVWQNSGAGWDGLIYVDLTQNFHEILINKKISQYRITHSLPFLILHYLWQLFGYRFENTQEVVKAMLVFNYSMVLLSIPFMLKICKHFKFSIKTKFLVFTALYMTVPLLKKFMYIPIGTDITAFTIGIVSFYYFIKRKYIGLIIASFLGGFTYPSMGYAGLLLFAISPDFQISRSQINKMNISIKVIILSIFIFGLYQVFHIGFQSLKSSQQLNLDLLFLSIPAIFIYLFFLLKPVRFTIKTPEKLSLKTFLPILAGILFITSYLYVRDSLSSSLYNAMSPIKLIKSVLYGSITNPLVPIVCHISYFGPFIILVMIFWRKIYSEVEKLGLSMVLFIGLYLLLSLGRESRQFINAWPFFVFITAIYLDKLKLSWRFIYIFIGLSFIFSKVWFTINVPGISEKGGLLNFPAQRFFMMNGPWMSTDMYFVHLAAALIATIIIFIFLRNEKKMIVSVPKFLLSKKNQSYDQIPRSIKDKPKI